MNIIWFLILTARLCLVKGIPPLQLTETGQLMGDEFPTFRGPSMARLPTEEDQNGTDSFQENTEEIPGNASNVNDPTDYVLKEPLSTNLKSRRPHVPPLPPGESIRLPRNLWPIHYRIYLRPVLRDGVDFEQYSVPGNVTITFGCLNVTDKIVVHRLNMEVDEANIVVRNAEGQEIPIAGQNYNKRKEFHKIFLEEPLKKGAIYEVFITFTGTIQQKALEGMYLSHYNDAVSGEKKTLLATLFEPTDARQVFPCFDEPEFKATFEMSVARTQDYHVLSNTALDSSELDPEYSGWVWDHFQPVSVNMSTYLVAIVISDFDYEEAPEKLDGTKPLRIYASPHLIAEGGGVYAAKTALDIIRFYEKYTGIPYALDKLDSVAIPHFGPGAMENWGLNTYRTRFLINRPGESTEVDRKMIARVLSHEIAHQWFGNLVTCRWWSHAWLNEGFSSYMEFRALHSATPEFDVLPSIIGDASQIGMIYDQGRSTHPIVQEVNSDPAIRGRFSLITYRKGAALLRMLEGILGTEAFDEGVRSYLKEKAFSVAEQKDLFNAFQKTGKHGLEGNMTLHQVMRSWTSESGYPLVRVTPAGDNSIYLSQEKFILSNGSVHYADNKNSWYIPVRVVTPRAPDFGDKRPNTWIREGIAFIKYTDSSLDTKKWMIVNPEMTGFYRVLYDESMRQLIKEQLLANASVFTPGTRSQLLDDYFHFGFNGYAPIEAALELTEYLHQETHIVVWTQLIYHMRNIFRRFSADDGAFSNFQSFYAPRIAAVLNRIGWIQHPEERGIKVILRASLLDFACAFVEPQCIKYSQGLFKKWHPVENRAIPPDLRPVVFCSVVAQGNQEIWDKAFEFYQDEPRHTTKLQLYRALACSNDRQILSRFLQLALDNTTSMDIVSVSQLMAGNSVGRQVAYEFLKENFGPKPPVGPREFLTVASVLSQYWNTQRDIDDLQNFLDDNGGHFPEIYQPVINQMVGRIQSNIAWFEDFGKPISAWLQRFL